MIIDDDKRRDAMIDKVREELELTCILLAPLKLQTYLSEVYQDTGNYQKDYQYLMEHAQMWKSFSINKSNSKEK